MSVRSEPFTTIAFLREVADRADAVAFATSEQTVSYRDLDEAMQARAHELGGGRRLVLVAMARRLDPVITYLAALAAGHVALLVDGGRPETVADAIARWDPDVVHHDDGSIEVRHRDPVHDLHPELALLLSTSGSTGSPRLVRLPAEGVSANAQAIAGYLGLTAADRGVTTLPLHYCYGLSVLHAHLSVGAGVVLGEASVVDPCFWDQARRHGVTGIAGVPHTFEMLDRVRSPHEQLPTLRYVTQAGGRLAPDAVRRWADQGRREGWELFVMYGQTEATARMAYLPPSLACERPDAVGVAVEGGAFQIVPVAGQPEGVGEVRYRGPNVMLGYADHPRDLARGRDVHELATGDLGRIAEDGLLEIVGRASRFVKPLGLRIDLDHLERQLAVQGSHVVCTGDDDGVVVGVAPPPVGGTGALAARAAARAGLPAAGVVVVGYEEIPRLASGKPDLAGVLADGRVPPPAGVEAIASSSPAGIVAAVLGGRSVDDQASFVDLGGDSLTYVEASIRLEALLGSLPPDWHHQPLASLTPGRRRRWLRPVDTSVAVRAAAIMLVLVTHSRVALIHGGAHALVAVAGWNFASFQLRSGRMGRSIARVALPAIAYISVVAAVTSDFGWRHALLVNGLIGDEGTRWAFWFVESLVLTLALLWAAWQVPAVRRLEARHRFGLPMGLAMAGLAFRFDLVGPFGEHEVLRPEETFWLFALGWAGARATTIGQRVLVSALLIAAVPGFFDDMPGREARVLLLVLALLWVPRIWVPAVVAPAIAAIAAASLGIYLVHWEVLPILMPVSKPLTVVVATVAGLALWAVLRRATALAERVWDGAIARQGSGSAAASAPLEAAVGVGVRPSRPARSD
jgi:acyl-coenzyme A synthetase/AMP-(fatty) acid ligase